MATKPRRPADTGIEEIEELVLDALYRIELGDPEYLDGSLDDVLGRLASKLTDDRIQALGRRVIREIEDGTVSLHGGSLFFVTRIGEQYTDAGDAAAKLTRLARRNRLAPRARAPRQGLKRRRDGTLGAPAWPVAKAIEDAFPGVPRVEAVRLAEVDPDRVVRYICIEGEPAIDGIEVRTEGHGTGQLRGDICVLLSGDRRAHVRVRSVLEAKSPA